MPEPQTSTDPLAAIAFAGDLKARVGALIDGLVHKDDEVYEAEFVHLLTRVRELVDRKMSMEGTKTDTRDFLGELMFTRLRRGMHMFLRSDDDITSLRAAEWVMGVLFAVTTMSAASSRPDCSRRPVDVKHAMRSVITSARPARSALNRSPSGSRHRRWRHGS